MASAIPPKRGVAYSTEICLVSQADTDVFQTTVTLAAGDVVVYQDGVLDGNIDALPVEIGTSGVLVVTLSATEMTADRVAVKFHDVAGDQWQDLLVTIETVTISQIDDLSTASALATVDSNVDSILADTGTDGVILANDAITAAKIAADAITSSELAASAVAEIVDGIWDEAMADHTTADTTGEALNNAGGGEAPTIAGIWSYATRTLTQVAATVGTSVSSGAITIVRGDTLSASLTGLGNLTGYVSLDFTVKVKHADTDDNALIRIRKNASGVGDGLLRLNRAAAATATNGSITIDNLTSGNITIALAAAETDDLSPATGLAYDVQMIKATGVTTLATGAAHIVADITRLIE